MQCLGQLELGRSIAPTVLQPEHCYENAAGASDSDLSAGSVALQRT